MPDNLRAVLVDGLEIQTTPQGAQVIERLQRQLVDAAKVADGHISALDSLRADHAKDIQSKDAAAEALKNEHLKALSARDGQLAALDSAHKTELAAKDGEIDALRARIPTGEALDALITEREEIINSARRLMGDSFAVAGKGNADIKREVVQKHLGARSNGQDDGYISAAFDTLVVAVPANAPDKLRVAIRNQPAIAADAEDGRAEARREWENMVKYIERKGA